MQEYAADEREFNETELANGLKCVFVRDPRMEKVAVQLDIGGGHASDPADLNGIASVSSAVVLRGSARFPGVDNLLNFVIDYGIDFQNLTYVSHSRIVAEMPHEAFDEYLDRLSDMVANPMLSQEGLDYSKLRIDRVHYQDVTDVNLKEVQVREYLLFGKKYQRAFLFSRKDLLPRVRDYFGSYYHAKNMTIFVMGGMSIESMSKRVGHYFERLANTPAIPRSTLKLSRIDHDFNKTLRVDKDAVLAKTFTKTDDKILCLDFQLPPKMSTSSCYYVAYLFNMSQMGSLQQNLKLRDLIKHSSAKHVTYSIDTQLLKLKFLLTDEGCESIHFIVSHVLGYVEILKQRQPSLELYYQAREYYRCLNDLCTSFATLDCYQCELLLGSQVCDLRDAGFPRIFDPEAIRSVLKSLTLGNCDIVAISDRYVDAPVQEGSEYFLQLSIENFIALPTFGGLVHPR